MAKIPITFLKELNDSIVWMSAPNLRALRYHEEGADKDKPFAPVEECIGLRYAASVVILKDNLVRGYMKRKDGEALLSRLDEAYRQYACYHINPEQQAKDALASLAEINKEIELPF